MSENTVTVAKKTSEKAAAAVAEASPFVVEAVEAVLENPTKVAGTIKWGVVSISVLAGAGLGAGALWGVNKWRNRSKKIDENIIADDNA